MNAGMKTTSFFHSQRKMIWHIWISPGGLFRAKSPIHTVWANGQTNIHISEKISIRWLAWNDSSHDMDRKGGFFGRSVTHGHHMNP